MGNLSGSVQFDYMTFLESAGEHRLSLRDVCFNWFNHVTHSSTRQYDQASDGVEALLMQQAMYELSACHSDDANLEQLVHLARQYGVKELDVIMPYALEPEQLCRLQGCGLIVRSSQEEHLSLELLPDQ